MKLNKKMFFYTGLFSLFVVLAALVFLPSHKAFATEPPKQDLKECLDCHDQEAKLWENSHHKESNVSCVVCHKLADSTGEHPDSAKYTVESQETTCLVCHAEVVGENIAGQLAISKHGEVGLTCISCHEQHSQGLKLSEGSRTVCENCHKSETKSMLKSTHFAAGLSCVNCHMGKDKNHTLVVAVATCDECHTDLHESKRMLDAGLEVKVMDQPEAMAEITPAPAETETVTAPVTGGVHMPSWTLVFAGMLIGGIISWALVGKDPGKPSNGE
ncbi:MAG: multiheme c-type cytochrome [Anaerolineales bacterium]